MAYIRKRGNLYQIRVSCGMDDNGEQTEQTMTWKPDPGMTEKQTEKEVQCIAFEFEERCKNFWNSSHIKFKALAENWFKEYAELNLKSTSLERMKQLTVRVYPAIGHLSLDKIRTVHIQDFVNHLVREDKNLKTGKPLARKTVVHHLSFISMYSLMLSEWVWSQTTLAAEWWFRRGKQRKRRYILSRKWVLFLSCLNQLPSSIGRFLYLQHTAASARENC